MAIYIGEVVELVAIARFSDGSVDCCASPVSWRSDNPRVAVVAGDGTLVGVTDGSTVISASLGTANESLDVEVKESPFERSTVDRPDEADAFGFSPGRAGDPQVHVVYAVPSDMDDANLDRFGVIQTSLQTVQEWLGNYGLRLRLDTFNGGNLDVTFLPLPGPLGADAESVLASIRDGIRDSIGFAPNKVYAVFHEGNAELVNGGALGIASGNVASVHLPSRTQGWTNDFSWTGFALTMLHELLHVFGAVPSCAPNYINLGGGHVNDDPNDLMFAGPGADRSGDVVMDAARDDYFRHGQTDCLDTADSPFWRRASVRATSRSFPVATGTGHWPIRCGVH